MLYAIIHLSRGLNFRMRPLHQDESTALFEKLANYIGSENIKRLLQRSEGTYVFRLDLSY